MPHFHKRLYTFCIHNLAGIFLLILYTKGIQMFVEMWYIFCIHSVQLHFVYISCTNVVYKMYTQFPCGMRVPILTLSIVSCENLPNS